MLAWYIIIWGTLLKGFTFGTTSCLTLSQVAGMKLILRQLKVYTISQAKLKKKKSNGGFCSSTKLSALFEMKYICIFKKLSGIFTSGNCMSQGSPEKQHHENDIIHILNAYGYQLYTNISYMRTYMIYHKELVNWLAQL